MAQVSIPILIMKFGQSLVESHIWAGGPFIYVADRLQMMTLLEI